LEIAKRARSIMLDKKGEDIIIYDVRKISSVADYYVVVTGNSTPHLKALVEDVRHQLKTEGMESHRKSGEPLSGWLLLDYLNTVIHVFSKEIREYYAIEDLWSKAPRIA